MNNPPPRPPSFVDPNRHPAMQTADYLILSLADANNREIVLMQLNSLIFQEITSMYQKISPSTLTMRESTRFSNALAVFQCMASHPDARVGLVRANLSNYLLPFLHISTKEKPLENLRHCSLGVIGSLAKFDEPYGEEILNRFLETEIFPLCLHCIESGDIMTQKAATFIVMKILRQDKGLDYCCPEHFPLLLRTLRQLVQTLTENNCAVELKYVVQCYLNLTRLPWIHDALRRQLPPQLRHNTIRLIRQDPEVQDMLQIINSTLGRRP